MADENLTVGSTRNVPSLDRPTTGGLAAGDIDSGRDRHLRVPVAAHAADRLTYYTVFVMDLASRRVHALGSTPHPDDVFMGQVVRLGTAADDGVLIGHRVLICDRDRKWSGAVRQRFGDAGLRVVLTPVHAPNANAHAERFVRSIKEECLGRMIPLGDGTSDARSRSLWSTIIANGITKDSTIG